VEFIATCFGACAWLGLIVGVLCYFSARKVGWPIRIGVVFLLVAVVSFPAYSMLRFLILDEPLQAAARRGDLSEVRAGLARGADPNAPGEFGPPLQAAIRGDAPLEVVENLLRAGADPNYIDFAEEGSPLRIAIHRGNKGLAELLRKYGAR
jgi:ankyrin repeat protein